MKDYLLVLLSVALLAFTFILSKVYQRRSGSDTGSAAVYNMVSAICSIIILFSMNGFIPEFTPYSLINAILRSGCGFLYSLIGFKILERGSMAIYMLFLMSGGMAVPAVYGWLFLGEDATPLRVVGIIVIMISIALSNSGIKKPDKRLLIMCCAVFLLNGGVSTFSKIHQANTTYEIVGTSSYALMGSLASLTMSTTAKLGETIKNAKKSIHKPSVKLSSILIIILSSIIGTASSLLQLEGAKNLDASVLYPMITGGTIALTGIFARVFFGEKPSRSEWIGIGLCIVGTCMFL